MTKSRKMVSDLLTFLVTQMYHYATLNYLITPYSVVYVLLRHMQFENIYNNIKVESQPRWLSGLRRSRVHSL